MNELDEYIEEVIKTQPEDKWVSLAKDKFPNASDGYIVSMIEIFHGGDLKEINDDQTST